MLAAKYSCTLRPWLVFSADSTTSERLRGLHHVEFLQARMGQVSELVDDGGTALWQGVGMVLTPGKKLTAEVF